MDILRQFNTFNIANILKHWYNKSRATRSSRSPATLYGPDIYQHSCQGSNLNSQNWSTLWPWPAVMEGWRSKWSACCTSTLFPELIGIIIGEIGRVVSEEKRTQTATSQTYKFTKSKYFVTLTCSHEGVKVKMKCTLHIYIVPSVDWYHHWRNRSSSFGVEANTNYYPSAKIIHKIEVFCDLDLQSWRGPGQNEVHVAHLHCSLSWLVSSLEKSVE